MMSQPVQVHRELDIRGEVCPYTFVKTKLVLETMQSGQILRVITDHEPATENVPRSCQAEGNEVLHVGQLKEREWEILVRKR